MTGTLERRQDGSFALSINGDLQFDSTDERIYHECLVLPALSIVCKRRPGDLRVLIIGGGDGLAAREVFKCTAVRQVDLVDYDPAIVEMGRREFATLNQGSLLDSRLTVHNLDAWDFVTEAAAKCSLYDLVVCDLTVPDDIQSARFHSVQWYQMLAALAGEYGVVAANGLSPEATPWAFCSVFNSMTAAGLYARPCRVRVPSFAARGYGDDWGFFVASKTGITAQELDSSSLPEPRQYLRDMSQARDLFALQAELLEVQPFAQPALSGSGIILRYFHKGTLEAVSGTVVDAFSIEHACLTIPLADAPVETLPQEVTEAFARLLEKQSTAHRDEAANPSEVLQEILELVPSLNGSHTPEMIEDFLQQPDSFLYSVDLKDLVARLLQRASGTLPPHIVAELNLMASTFAEWTGDQMSLMQLGRNVVAMLTLLIIFGNLMYPDAVYAKGDHHAAGHSKAANATKARKASGRRDNHPGRRGRRVGDWYGGWAWDGNNWLDEKEYIRKYPKKPLYKPGKKPPELEIRNYSYSDATRTMLIANREEAADYHAVLMEELNQYVDCKDELVQFGLRVIPRQEAIDKQQQLLAQNKTKIAALDARIRAMDS